MWELQERVTQGFARGDSCSCLPTAVVCSAAPVLDPFTVAMERLENAEVPHPPVAARPHRIKYLFVNLKGKYNKITFKTCV